MTQFDEIVQQLIDFNNRHIDDFNELFDRFDEVQTKNEALIEKQESTDKVMDAQHEAIKKNFEDNKALKQALINLTKTSDHQIKELTKD